MNVIELSTRPRRPKKTPAVHINHLGLAVPDNLLAKIENAAWMQKISRSEFVRRVLEKHFEGEKK